MKVVKGKEGVTCTEQDDFTENASCDCGGNARLAFVAQEDTDRSPDCVCNLHRNEYGSGGKFWPHDCIAVAIYFCEKCAKAVVRWNQA